MDDFYCLRWAHHSNLLSDVAYKFLEHKSLVDVTLACQEYGEIHTFKAHQIILSACSPYFESILIQNNHPHPIIFLKDVKRQELEDILMFVYTGEMNVHEQGLKSILVTAKSLMIRGLSDEVADLTSPGDNRPPNAPNRVNIFLRKRKTTSDSETCSAKMSASELAQEESHEMEHKYTPMEGNLTDSKIRAGESNHREDPMDYSASSAYRNLSCNDAYEYQASENRCSSSLEGNRTARRISSSSDYTRSSFDAKHDEFPEGDRTSTVSIPKHSENASSLGNKLLYPQLANNDLTITIPLNVHPSYSQTPKRAGHFQSKWMEIYSWLRYDKEGQKMFCTFCRRWGDHIPNIRRTSFVDGNCNFRFEIVKHHDCSKSHKICVHKDEMWRSENEKVESTRFQS